MPPQATLLVACDAATFVSTLAICVALLRLIRACRGLTAFRPLAAAFAILGAGGAGVFLVAGLMIARPDTWSRAAIDLLVAGASGAAAITLLVLTPRIVLLARQADESTRRRAELEEAARAAAAGETRFRALLEAAPDATITVGEDGRVALVNSQVEAIFGYSRDELVGQPVEVLLPESLRGVHEGHRRAYQREPRRRPMGVGLDLVARRKDGVQFPTEISLSPVRTDRGMTVIVVVRDITERKKAESERAALVREQAARSEAEAASRAKDEFVAVISHELRTPLNAILGWTTLLKSRRVERDVADHALEAIERNANVQRQVIDDLLDVSRMITGKIPLDLEEVDLRQVIAAAVDSVRPAADGRHLALHLMVDPAVPAIRGDVRRLQQVVWNLLANAVKFTPEHGAIRVSATVSESHVELQVADSGAGIDAAFLPHVFDRFSQRDSSSTRAHGGLGLGLAIVRQLVELHGGTVRADSGGEGCGSVFTVTLPLPAERKRPESPGESREDPVAGVSVPGLGGVADSRGAR